MSAESPGRVLTPEVTERLLHLLDWMSDHGGGARGPLADCDGPCPSCEARDLAAELRAPARVSSATDGAT